MSNNKQWIELDEKTFTTMFKEFEKNSENKLKINLEKSIENLSQTNVTFSRQSIEDTVNAFQVFISAKLLQHWNKNDMPPSKATIEIEVKIES